ncbi:hypothetical protein LLEC1_01657 [Akanthomyces lecanii]|uniref:Uncharacterized protein n=1 Tax=Cordyceps confragosa TaxID=2714763 RepID=A0A179HZW7_CORDF|nr:hypothetical protein LLEC1_01657 [Akanthomyces lecanii]
MDTMRVLDQHIDRSLWPIEAAEAAKYQFIWTATTPRSHRNEADRSRRRPSEHRLTSVLSEPRAYQKGGAVARNGSGLLQACWRSVKAPRKQTKKLLTKDKIAAGDKPQWQDGERRWSETTLVEKPSSLEERKGAEK